MKPSIPSVGHAIDPQVKPILRALKENIEILTGRQRAGTIDDIAETANLAEVKAKINEILARLQ